MEDSHSEHKDTLHENKSLSMDGRAFQAMWSTVVLFVLTFAVFGLLLGFAEVYKSSDGEEEQAATVPATAPEATGNSTSAQTQGNISAAGG